MPIDRKFRLARHWSNRELRLVGPRFRGEVVNVSAGDDIDKEGGHYRDYFPNASGYSITNHAPGSFRGFRDRPGEILLDLTQPLPRDLVGRFDVVFNHTTLEHIFEVRQAFAHLCELSRDIVIVVVPLAQAQHQCEDFGDYWRFTPTCIRELFRENGLEVVLESANNDVNAATYVFCIGSKEPAEWRDVLPPTESIETAASWIGDRRSRCWRRGAWRRALRRLFGPGANPPGRRA